MCLTLLEGIEVCYACAVIYMFGVGVGGFILLLLLKWLVFLSCLMLMCVCVGGGGGGGRQNNVFTLLKRLLLFFLLFSFFFSFFHYTYDLIFLPFSSTVSLSVHVFSCDWNWYWCLYCFCCHIQHTMFGGSVWLYEAVLLVFALYLWSYLVLMLCIMHYTVCYLTGIFYAVVRQISMLFIDNKISVFCIL